MTINLNDIIAVALGVMSGIGASLVAIMVIVGIADKLSKK